MVDKTIGGLASASALADADLLEIEKAGNSRKAAASVLLEYVMANATVPIDVKTADYVVVADDANRLLRMNAAGANSVTINSGVLSVGEALLVEQAGAGATTIVAGAGVTVLKQDTKSLATARQYQQMALLIVATDTVLVTTDAVTQADVTAHQAALSIARTQIGNFVTSALGNITGTASIDMDAAEQFTATVTGDVTITPSNGGRNGGAVLYLTDGGAHSITWSGVLWDGGAAPSLSASGVDVIAFSTPDSGTTIYGYLAGAAMA